MKRFLFAPCFIFFFGDFKPSVPCIGESHPMHIKEPTSLLPLFDYGDVIYSSTFKKHTDKLQKLQNRAGRIILKVKPEHHVSVSEMHNALNWQLLDKRRLDHSLVFMYKILNDLTSTYLRNEFQYVPQHYSSRFGEILHLPKPRTEHLKRSFKYRCAKAYNVLPPVTKSSSTVHAFKSRITHTYVQICF